MHEVIGSVDDRGRPLVRLQLQGREDDMLVIVDTAFTGELLLSSNEALQWGVMILDVESDLELGDYSKVVAKQGLVTAEWLGRQLDVTVQVTPDPTTPAGSRQQERRRDGAPVGLLGTGMLSRAILSIDFPQRVVSVRPEPDS